MKLETYLAIRALLSADSTIHPTDRMAILAAVRNHGRTPEQPKKRELPQVISRDQAAKMLNCVTRTIDTLGKQNLLPKVHLPGRKRGGGILLSDVINLIEDAHGKSVMAKTKGLKADAKSLNPMEEDDLVLLAEKIVYGASTSVEKARFKRLAVMV